MLLHSVLSLFLLPTAAFSPSGEGPCYHIDGSEDTTSSACYVLDSVGATMCCRDSEQCSEEGLCFGKPVSLIGTYDNDTSIWRRSCTDFFWQNGACIAIAPDSVSSAAQLSRCSDASYCPRSADNLNETCCENHQGTMAGLEQAPIAASLVSSIRAIYLTTTTTIPPSPTEATTSRTIVSETPSLPTTPDPTSPASSTNASGSLSQETKVALGIGLPTLFVTTVGIVLGRSWWTRKKKRKSMIQNA